MAVEELGLSLDTGTHGRRGLRRRIGYLPQEFGCDKRSMVRERVAYTAWLKEGLAVH